MVSDGSYRHERRWTPVQLAAAEDGSVLLGFGSDGVRRSSFGVRSRVLRILRTDLPRVLGFRCVRNDVCPGGGRWSPGVDRQRRRDGVDDLVLPVEAAALSAGRVAGVLLQRSGPHH